MATLTAAEEKVIIKVAANAAVAHADDLLKDPDVNPNDVPARLEGLFRTFSGSQASNTFRRAGMDVAQELRKKMRKQLN